MTLLDMILGRKPATPARDTDWDKLFKEAREASRQEGYVAGLTEGMEKGAAAGKATVPLTRIEERKVLVDFRGVLIQLLEQLKTVRTLPETSVAPSSLSIQDLDLTTLNIPAVEKIVKDITAAATALKKLGDEFNELETVVTGLANGSRRITKLVLHVAAPATGSKAKTVELECSVPDAIVLLQKDQHRIQQEIAAAQAKAIEAIRGLVTARAVVAAPSEPEAGNRRIRRGNDG